MSDTSRQSISEQIKNAVKPDSQKGFGEHMGDKLRGKTDRAQAHMEPNSEKSYTQAAFDTVRGGVESISEKTKEMFQGDNTRSQ